MALKTFKPTTPSLRGLVQVDRSALWKGRPVKSLLSPLKNATGRNNRGRITAWNKGGGHKKLYREIDFKRSKKGMFATVERLEYDPNRTAFIALIKYEDGTVSYILSPEGLAAKDRVISGDNADIRVGNALPLANIPIGAFVHNIELKAGKGGQLIRTAGGSASIVGKDAGYVSVKLRSGEVRLILAECYATIGVLSNSDQKNVKIGKAGRNRWLGKRPTVRGVAMNPIDHPHGGGEGKTSGGRHPVTPWGKSTKGNMGKRSSWKPPFVDGFLLKKADAAIEAGSTKPIKTMSRRSTILPKFVGLNFEVYNGKKYISVRVKEEMVGHKLGEFSLTRTFQGHSGHRKEGK
jgi:large subunit ribosomal protein L2